MPRQHQQVKKSAKPSVGESAGFKLKKEKEEIKQKIAELGLEEKINDLPPDEVDYKDVERDLNTSIAALIPYTQAWYEAKAAEEELDDLKRIRSEIQRANELVTMTKIGRQEEALEMMMEETNNDFHYFNKLKNKEVNRGKYEYRPFQLDPFKDISQGRNRLKKSLKMQFAMIDSSLLNQLNKKSRKVLGKGGKHDPKDMKCPWRGKGKGKMLLQCSNNRMIHPTKTYKDMYGKERPEILPECCYHLTKCSGYHIGLPPTIKISNSKGLCGECYFVETKLRPPTIAADLIPGICPYIPEVNNTGSSSTSITQEDSGAKSLSNADYCTWRPSKVESLGIMRGYICRNVKFRNPETSGTLPTCPMHVIMCIRSHSDGKGQVEIPNIYGLCIMHHVAEYGQPPVRIPFPFPGVIRRLRDKGWTVKPEHWAAPTWFPLKDINLHRYIPKPKPSSFIEKLSEILMNRKFNEKVHKSERQVILIQRAWRRFRAKNEHLRRRFMKMRQLRATLVVVIQSQARRRIAWLATKKRRMLFNRACTQIQRVFRGFRARLWLKMDLAARVIQRFMGRLASINFRDAISWTVRLKKARAARHKAALVLLRAIRTFRLTRDMVRRRKAFRRRRAAAWLIGRTYRRYRRSLQPAKAVIPEGDFHTPYNGVLAELMARHGKRLRRLAGRMEPLQAKAPFVQAIIRGYLGRATRDTLKISRARFHQFVNPKRAMMFMKKLLANNIGAMVRTAAPLPVARNTQFLAPLLPVLLQGLPTVTRDRFEEALLKVFLSYLVIRFYNNCQCPLPEEEKLSLLKRYRNLEDGSISVLHVDDLISIHVYEGSRSKQFGDFSFPACSRHGRKLCGDCLYHRECRMMNCPCKLFCSAGRPGAACSRCGHPPFWHRLCPLNLKPNRKNIQKTSLLRLLHQHRDADVGTTRALTVRGLDADTLLTSISIANANASTWKPSSNTTATTTGYSTRKTGSTIREKVTATFGARANDSQTTSRITAASAASSLATSLARCQVNGGGLNSEQQVDYWGQRYSDLTSLDGSSSSSFRSPDSILSKRRKNKSMKSQQTVGTVTGDSHSLGAPATSSSIHINIAKPAAHSLSSSVLWKTAAKNPNKNVRDIEEKFECNVPFSFAADGQVVYTLEGSKVYLALLKKIQLIGQSGKERLHADNAELVRLVIDHLQVFDRHWRKMLIDLRDGVLNRHVRVSRAERLAYEAGCSPQPALASELESAFRGLGFHAKSVAKDTVYKAYAEPRSFVTSDSTLVDNSISNSNSTSTSNPVPLASASPSSTVVTASGNFTANQLDETGLSSASSSSLTYEEEYNKQTDPKPRLIELLYVNGRFLCPFPGCGESFLVHNTAFEHLSVHERRRHIVTATPLPDSMLSRFWPADIPWRTDEKYTKELLPSHQAVCPVPGCGVTQRSEARIQKHLRSCHPGTVLAAMSRKKFYYFGKYLMVPPFDPPDDIPVQWCPNHTPKHRSYCPLCRTVEDTWGPKPPYKFYESLRINLTEICGKGGEITIAKRDPDKGVLVSLEGKSPGSSSVVRGRPLELVFDHRGTGWIALQQLLNYDEALESSASISRDFNIAHELVPVTLSNGAPRCQWVKVDMLRGSFFFLSTTLRDFKYRLNNSMLPEGGSIFFIRIGEE